MSDKKATRPLVPANASGIAPPRGVAHMPPEDAPLRENSHLPQPSTAETRPTVTRQCMVGGDTPMQFCAVCLGRITTIGARALSAATRYTAARRSCGRDGNGATTFSPRTSMRSSSKSRSRVTTVQPRSRACTANSASF